MVKLINVDEKGASEAEVEAYLLVTSVSNRYGVDPSSSVECERFFQKLLAEYTGDLDDLEPWLERQIPQYFMAIGERPRWKQGADWPFANGSPMIFAGQIDISIEKWQQGRDIYHDDTSLYVFIAKRVQPVVIVQQL